MRMGDQQPERVTLERVAGVAGVSVKTASLALRGDASVARATTIRVRAAAAELGYVSRGTRRQVIGVIVPYIGHRVYSDLFGYLRREASSYEFTTLLAEGMGEPATEKSLLAELRWRGVDGVVLVAPRLSAEELDVASRFQQPIVTIGMPPPHQPETSFARIEINHVAGGRLATEHLLESGRKRIAYLAGRVPSASDQGRRSGYRMALEQAGLRLDERLIVELERHVVQPWPDYELGLEQCVRLLSRNVDFDAILAYSDAIAIGALRALHERTPLQVPRDVSIVGFDGLAVGQYMVPKLTSVGVPWYRVALAALEAVIGLMHENRPRVAPVQQFEPQLMLGESGG
jgi:LacI family transcriptional regulator, galactose operon repressor